MKEEQYGPKRKQIRVTRILGHNYFPDSPTSTPREKKASQMFIWQAGPKAPRTKTFCPPSIRLNLCLPESEWDPRQGWHWASRNIQDPKSRRRNAYFYGKRQHEARSERVSLRDQYLLRNYGLMSSDVEAMIRSQGSSCSACSTRFEGAGKTSTAPVVDHCHSTGKVRGILCNRCNRALGSLGDDPDAVEGLARYIRSFS